MNRYLNPLRLVAFFLIAGISNSIGSTKIEEISDLPPGEQYRQLSLILLISGGAKTTRKPTRSPPRAGFLLLAIPYASR